LNLFSDIVLFEAAIAAFRPEKARCPLCGAKGRLSFHSDYDRYPGLLKEGAVVYAGVCIPRYLCSSCNHTHAVLPDILIPYGRYSLRVVLLVLAECFRGGMTVRALCEKHGIAVSTLYAWKDRFEEHKALFLGALENLRITAEAFNRSLLESDMLSGRLRPFWRTHAFSFLQCTPRVATRSLSP
jgi:transposase-like protein